MHEGVSDILVARARELDGVARPVSASFAVHVGIVLTLALLPSAWFARAAPEKPMMIDLGAGAVGPKPDGLTALSAKKVDAVAPPPTRPEPVLPTAPKSTALTEPVKAPVKPPEPPKRPSTQSAPVTKPQTGAQVTQGTATAATTATNNIGVGLSSGGLGAAGLDSNFCCPDWARQMIERIKWQPNQGVAGDVEIQIVVERDGTISGWTLTKKSNVALLDLDAQRAVIYAKLPPLPPEYTPSRLNVTLQFKYIR
jgi:outer membrane biosynthesis protein TonB